MSVTPIGQGPAVAADAEALAKDAVGYTHPNLHRRISTPTEGTNNHHYELGIYGTDSYRTTEVILHDEESTTSEIP